MSEARITINGRPLDEGQAMTVRVAIESFAAELVENGLGDDPHGVRMRDGYMRRICELRAMMRGAAP